MPGAVTGLRDVICEIRVRHQAQVRNPDFTDHISKSGLRDEVQVPTLSAYIKSGLRTKLVFKVIRNFLRSTRR